MITTWPQDPETAAKALRHIRLVRRLSVIAVLASLPLTILIGLAFRASAPAYLELFLGTWLLCLPLLLARWRLRCPRCEEPLEPVWGHPLHRIWTQLAQQCPHCRLSLAADRDYRWPHPP
jgi:hypothetical protein